MAIDASQLATALAQQKSLHPTEAWLSTFVSTQRPSTPIPSIVQSAQFRLLNSDIRETLTKSPAFPAGIFNPRVEQSTIRGAIVVQVLDVEDLSTSRWNQVEDIEAQERGERTQGREIIRFVAAVDGTNQDTSSQSRSSYGATHRLLLQDAAGNRAYAIELFSVPGISLQMDIGCKILLKEASVARGYIMLDPDHASIIGGKIEALHQTWRANRKQQLTSAIAEQADS